MDPALSGMHIAILVTDGFEQVEMTEPKAALEREGAIIKIVSDKHGEVQGCHHDKPGDRFPVDLQFSEADAESFNAIVLPGGAVNSSHIRNIPEAQAIVQAATEEGKPIAVICHGAWLLVSAGLVEGRTMTSWPSLESDIRDAGGEWVDQEVVIDGNWVSSRKPDDLPAFSKAMVDVMAGNMRAQLRGKADEHAVGIASS